MAKRIETIAEMLAHGSVVSWNMRDTPTRAHGKYAIRLELTFLDGATQRRVPKARQRNDWSFLLH